MSDQKVKKIDQKASAPAVKKQWVQDSECIFVKVPAACQEEADLIEMYFSDEIDLIIADD